MPAATKNKKTAEQLYTLVNAVFAPCKPVEIQELDQGLFNAAYALRLSDGRRLVLKIAPPKGAPVLRHEQDLMSAEVKGMTMALTQARVPVPKVLNADFRCTHCDSPYFFMEYALGDSFLHSRQFMTELEQGQIRKEIGACSRAIHTIAGPGFGFLQNPSFQSWPDAFLFMVDSILLDARQFGANLPLSCEELRSLILPFFSSLRCVETPHLLHGDLWDGNILVQNGHISAILDFERALWGDPLMEFYFSGEAPLEDFMEGYGKDIWQEPAVKQRRTLYNLYFYLVLLVESTCRDNGNRGQNVWAAAKLRHEIRKLRNYEREGG